jgi:hypothetical protein
VKSSSRRTIPVTCTTHGGGKNFCNLLMTKESDGTIVLDPHVANCCVLRLDYAAATAVFDTLGEWLDDRASRLRTRRNAVVVGVLPSGVPDCARGTPPRERHYC